MFIYIYIIKSVNILHILYLKFCEYFIYYNYILYINNYCPLAYIIILANIVPFSVQFFLHGSDLNSLHSNVPKAILPNEYGGTAGKLDTSAWSQVLLASENDFAQGFCPADLARDGSLQGLVMNDSESDYLQCEESARGVKSQLYCY